MINFRLKIHSLIFQFHVWLERARPRTPSNAISSAFAIRTPRPAGGGPSNKIFTHLNVLMIKLLRKKKPKQVIR